MTTGEAPRPESIRYAVTNPEHVRPERGFLVVTTVDYATIGPAVGSTFPDFELPDAHGIQVSLNGWRAGRRALVVFYRSASW